MKRLNSSQVNVDYSLLRPEKELGWLKKLEMRANSNPGGFILSKKECENLALKGIGILIIIAVILLMFVGC